MEYGLWHEEAQDLAQDAPVLILVLMEYGLWLYTVNFNSGSSTES